MTHVVIVGAGPAGLYCAYLLKREFGDSVKITIHERNPIDTTWGFGVVFSEQALEFLANYDSSTHALVTPYLQSWTDIHLQLEDQRIVLDGIGFTAMDRLTLLRLLRQQLSTLNVQPVYSSNIQSYQEISAADLVIAADGSGSLLRQSVAEELGVRQESHPNYFIWYGTEQEFPCLTQTFKSWQGGFYNAHHYRYAPRKSTFIVETDSNSWHETGFDSMNETETREYLEKVFASELKQHKLISNRSSWRNFPRMSVKSWSAGNLVLLGDALHTAHFSIGSGTRLALEDAVQLVKSLGEFRNDWQSALQNYEIRRRPRVEKLLEASYLSMDWYTDFPGHMGLHPLEFAYSYLQRSGRLDDATLARIAPRFMDEYRHHKQWSGC